MVQAELIVWHLPTALGNNGWDSWPTQQNRDGVEVFSTSLQPLETIQKELTGLAKI